MKSSKHILLAVFSTLPVAAAVVYVVRRARRRRGLVELDAVKSAILTVFNTVTFPGAQPDGWLTMEELCDLTDLGLDMPSWTMLDLLRRACCELEQAGTLERLPPIGGAAYYDSWRMKEANAQSARSDSRRRVEEAGAKVFNSAFEGGW